VRILLACLFVFLQGCDIFGSGDDEDTQGSPVVTITGTCFPSDGGASVTATSPRPLVVGPASVRCNFSSRIDQTGEVSCLWQRSDNTSTGNECSFQRQIFEVAGDYRVDVTATIEGRVGSDVMLLTVTEDAETANTINGLIKTGQIVTHGDVQHFLRFGDELL